jgi:hypothetical protein
MTVDFTRASNEFERRALIYWEAYLRTNSERSFNYYLFWREASILGKVEAEKIWGYLLF